MHTSRVLIADDEPIALENLAYVLRKEGYSVVCAENGARALEELGKDEFDLVMTDLRMQGADGMEVLEAVKRDWPDTEVVVITGFASVETAVEAVRKGAYDYVPKPYNIDKVRLLVHKALEKRALRQEVSELRRQVQLKQEIPLIIGKSPKMEELKKLIGQIAPADCSVLILGETGTGKELVAKTVHHLSSRADKRFLAVNCGALNEELLANELFGHEKEAFTGARGIKKGLIEAAHGGTIMLDEIGDMPMSMQVKLLRVLQERTLIRVGGTEEIPVDIRILAATNKDLKYEIEAGNFRQDLLYRLNVITLHVPSLSQRKDDIPLLCRHFMRKFSESQGKVVDNISEDASDLILNYEFPGNIRELENIIERAVTLSNGNTIEVAHLPPDIRQLSFQIKGRREREFMTLEENEIEYISWVLDQVNNNKTKAAELLGIDRVSLWRKLRRYNIDS